MGQLAEMAQQVQYLAPKDARAHAHRHTHTHTQTHRHTDTQTHTLIHTVLFTHSVLIVCFQLWCSGVCTTFNPTCCSTTFPFDCFFPPLLLAPQPKLSYAGRCSLIGPFFSF